MIVRSTLRFGRALGRSGRACAAVCRVPARQAAVRANIKEALPEMGGTWSDSPQSARSLSGKIEGHTLPLLYHDKYLSDLCLQINY